MTTSNSALKIRPEWQPAIVGWRRFVAARPDLQLKANYNGLTWFIRRNREEVLRSGVLRKVNGLWLCDVTRFPTFVFDTLLGLQCPSFCDVCSVEHDTFSNNRHAE